MNFVIFHVSCCSIILASSLLFLLGCFSILVNPVFCSSIIIYAIVRLVIEFDVYLIFYVVIAELLLFIVRVVGYGYQPTIIVFDINLSYFEFIIVVRVRVSHLVVKDS